MIAIPNSLGKILCSSWGSCLSNDKKPTEGIHRKIKKDDKRKERHRKKKNSYKCAIDNAHNLDDKESIQSFDRDSSYLNDIDLSHTNNRDPKLSHFHDSKHSVDSNYKHSLGHDSKYSYDKDHPADRVSIYSHDSSKRGKKCKERNTNLAIRFENEEGRRSQVHGNYPPLFAVNDIPPSYPHNGFQSHSYYLYNRIPPISPCNGEFKISFKFYNDNE